MVACATEIKQEILDHFRIPCVQNLIEHCKEYRRQGLEIIPLLLDGTKRPPKWMRWKEYLSRGPGEGAPDSWAIKFRVNVFGVAVICGSHSGGLEVIDFDREADTIFPAWHRMIEPIGVRLPIVETPSGGYHVYYRCPSFAGNLKIACVSRDEFDAEQATNAELGIVGKIKQVLIETRGEGGYVVGVLSPASVHERNYPYVQVAGPVLPEVPTITPEERLQLWKAARSFDRSGLLAEEIRKAKPKPFRSRPIGGEKPWTDFDRIADFPALLHADGWTTGDGVTWRRPGKMTGSGSATLRRGSGGDLLLTVFSTDAPIPTNFQADGKPYTASAYIAHARFGGDFKRANQAIREGIR